MANNIAYVMNTTGAIRAAALTVANEGYGFSVLSNNGAPVDGTSGTHAGLTNNYPGTLLVDVANTKLYINTNTTASPTWTVVGTQS
jgi:hypothetical protein